jgi:hypothetical protein
MLKDRPCAKHQTVASLCKVFGHKCHKSKKRKCFVATDGGFMAMVKCSAKMLLPSATGAGVFTVMTHSIRKTPCLFDILHFRPFQDFREAPGLDVTVSSI